MTQYWIDCVSGNDTNSGADIDHGWLTPAPLAALGGLQSGDILYWRGRYVAADDSRDSYYQTFTVRAGTKVAKTTIRGYDPRYPAEWWAAGKVLNGAGSLNGGGAVNWAQVATDVWECTLNTWWRASPWCFYWNGNQGLAAADQPRQLKLVCSDVDCLNMADSYWQDFSGACRIRVNVAGLGATSPSGRIIHGTRGYGLGGTLGADRLFVNMKHLMFAGFTYFNCGDRIWSDAGLLEHNCENIELRRSGLNYCEPFSDMRNVRVLGRGANMIFDRSDFIGGAYGNIYPDANNFVASVARGASGHVFSNNIITRCKLQDAGYSVRSQGDGHNLGLQGTGRDILFAGNLCDKGTNPIIIWGRSTWYPGVEMPRIRIERNLITNPHNSGAVGAQALTANTGSIQTTNGSKFIKVTTTAGAIIGVGWTVTIADSAPSETTLGGLAVTGNFTVAWRESATVFWLVSAGSALANATATSAQAHNVTVAQRGAWGTQGIGWSNADDDVGMDMSGSTVKGNVLRGIVQMLPPAEVSGTPLATTPPAFAYAPYNSQGIRTGRIQPGNVIPTWGNIVDKWPIGFWSTNGKTSAPKANNIDFRYNTIIDPRKTGSGTDHYGYVRLETYEMTYTIDNCDYNKFVFTGTGPEGEVAQWRDNSSIKTTLANWQASTLTPDLHSTDLRRSL